jgi:hypothetical protein
MTGFGLERHSASKFECLYRVWNRSSLYFGFGHIAAIRLIAPKDRSWPGADPGPLASSEANTMRLLNRLRQPDRLAESGQLPLKLVRVNP